jgi:hypothetical protein
MTQFAAVDTVGRHDLITIHGKPAPIPDPGLLVQPQFRWYAGCPTRNEPLALAQRERSSR